MELDATRCYRALLSRDPRFDGRFFTAVISTGIYCRPICPARPPRLENVRFFSCAAAAEAAGFRPCRRCRPESSPGTPAWSGTGATVARALRLIADGALDRGSVEELARRLGIGGRQLRRLFVEHLGATPHAVARTRRVHFARKLLDETRLSMVEVAHASGFTSVRQFNDAIKATFGRPPSALAARSKAGARAPGETDHQGSFRLRLPYRPPLAWESLLHFLAPRAIPGVEEVGARTYRRAIRLGQASGSIEVEPLDHEPTPCLELRVEIADAGALGEIGARTRRLFDLDADPQVIAAHLGRDPLLRPVVNRLPGLRVPGAWDRFETAVRAILGQEVTVRGATTLAGRLVRTFGEPAPQPRPGLTHTFPSPERLAGVDVASIGLPRKRAEAIRVFAAAVARGGILDRLASLDRSVRRMIELPGIGEWTAHYVAARALGEPDAFPASDLGIRRALADGRRQLPSRREVLNRAEAWRPWRAYAAMALWMSGSPLLPRNDINRGP